MKKRIAQEQDKSAHQTFFLKQDAVKQSNKKSADASVTPVSSIVPDAVVPVVTQSTSFSSYVLQTTTIHSIFSATHADSLKLKEINEAFHNGHLSEDEVYKLLIQRENDSSTLMHRTCLMGSAADLMMIMTMVSEKNKRALCMKMIKDKNNDDLLLPIHLLDTNPKLSTPLCTEQARDKVIKLYEHYTLRKESMPLSDAIDWQHISAQYASWLTSDMRLMALQQAWRALVQVRRRIKYSGTHPSLQETPIWQLAIKNTVMMRIISSHLEDVLDRMKGMTKSHYWRIRDLAMVIEEFPAANCEEYTDMVIRELLKIHCKLPLEVVHLTPGDHIVALIGREPASDRMDWRTWGSEALIIDAWSNKIYLANEIPQFLYDYAYYNEMSVLVPFDDTIHACRVEAHYDAVEFSEYHHTSRQPLQVAKDKIKPSSYASDGLFYMNALCANYGDLVRAFFTHEFASEQSYQQLVIQPAGEVFNVSFQNDKEVTSAPISINRVHFMASALHQAHREALVMKKHAVIAYLNRYPDVLNLARYKNPVQDIILEGLRFGIVTSPVCDTLIYITYQQYCDYFKSYLFEAQKVYGSLVLQYINKQQSLIFAKLEVTYDGFQLVRKDTVKQFLSFNEFVRCCHYAKEAHSQELPYAPSESMERGHKKHKS